MNGRSSSGGAGSVVVIGAGLAGLACAFDLVRAGVPTRVVEEEPRAGGVTGTIAVGGYTFERGPNTISSRSAEFIRLCDDAGVGSRLVESLPSARARWIFHRGRLRRVPDSIGAFVATRLVSTRAKLFLASEPLRRYQAPDGEREPSLEEFLADRLGPEASRVLGGAFVRGVYAAELSELGARSAFPKIFELATAHGGLARGMLARAQRKDVPAAGDARFSRHALLSFPSGMQELVDALARAIGPALRTGFSAARLARSADARSAEGRSAEARSGEARSAETWNVISKAGETLSCDRVVLAVPAPAAARLLATAEGGARLPLAHLRGIAHARMTLVHLGFDGRELALPEGFGFLVPPPARATPHDHDDDPARRIPREGDDDSAPPRMLGTLFTSNIFPGRAPEGCHAMTTYYRTEDLACTAPADWIAAAERDLARAIGVSALPRASVSEVQSIDDAIPRHSVGHAERMREVERSLHAALPRIHLTGSYLSRVSVEDVVAHGRALAARIVGAREPSTV